MLARVPTFRWFLSSYLAVVVPVCCCYTSALAGESTTPGPLHDHAEHGQRGAASVGHHHEEGQVGYGGYVPSGDDHPCNPGSHDHEGECDCGCSSGPDVFTPGAPGASVASDLTFDLGAAVVGVIDPAQLRHTAIISTPATRHRACTSLLQLHCALIV